MRKAAIFLGVAILAPMLGSAAVLFQTNFDDATGLSVLGTADTAVDFGWDYSAVGVPQNPNSGDTTALRLAANISAGAANEVAVVTSGQNFSGPYQVTFDFWVNANGPFPAGGTGSTEFGGGVVGHDGATAGRNGGSLIISGEGGSSRDWRLYNDATELFIADGVYSVSSNNAFSGDDPPQNEIELVFPGNAPPAAQGALDPEQNGVVQDGSGGFAWHTMTITVPKTGEIQYKVDGLEIGVLNAGAGPAVTTVGEAGVVYADIFSSVSDDPNYSFGLFDNLVVTDVPEPATMVLLGLGGLTAVLRRRR
jgi:hypothetical protein